MKHGLRVILALFCVFSTAQLFPMQGKSEFFWAIMKGNIAQLEGLFTGPDAGEILEKAPLMLWALHSPHSPSGDRRFATVEWLINHGANINKVIRYCEDRNGVVHEGSPLIVAIFVGDKEMVEMLIKLGAELDTREMPTDDTPLMLATRHQHLELVHLLIGMGVDVNRGSYISRMTPWLLSVAARERNLPNAADIERELLIAGASMERGNQTMRIGAIKNLVSVPSDLARGMRINPSLAPSNMRRILGGDYSQVQKNIKKVVQKLYDDGTVYPQWMTNYSELKDAGFSVNDANAMAQRAFENNKGWVQYLYQSSQSGLDVAHLAHKPYDYEETVQKFAPSELPSTIILPWVSP